MSGPHECEHDPSSFVPPSVPPGPSSHPHCTAKSLPLTPRDNNALQPLDMTRRLALFSHFTDRDMRHREGKELTQHHTALTRGTPVSHMGRLRLGELSSVVLDHTATSGQPGSPGLLCPGPGSRLLGLPGRASGQKPLERLRGRREVLTAGWASATRSIPAPHTRRRGSQELAVPTAAAATRSLPICSQWQCGPASRLLLRGGAPPSPSPLPPGLGPAGDMGHSVWHSLVGRAGLMPTPPQHCDWAVTSRVSQGSCVSWAMVQGVNVTVALGQPAPCLGPCQAILCGFSDQRVWTPGSAHVNCPAASETQ